jgi:hypothetical protein
MSSTTPRRSGWFKVTDRRSQAHAALEGTEVRGMVAITSVPEINVGVTGQ